MFLFSEIILVCFLFVCTFAKDTEIIQETDDLVMAESYFKHYKQDHFRAKYSRKRERRPYVNQDSHEMINKKETPFEYTFRMSRPRQPQAIIKDLNIRRKKLYMVQKIIEDLKKSKKTQITKCS